MLKNLIRVSSKTVQLTKKGEPNIWSNRDNVAKSTLGTLLQQIEKVNKENIEEDTDGDNSDNNDDVRMSFSYDIAIVSQILISLKKILVKLFLNEIIYNTPS